MKLLAMARRHGHSDGVADVVTEEQLRQADLSHLRLQDMTPGQRAELRRRYENFSRHFGSRAPPSSAEPKKKPRVRKWVPGAKR
jgi:hypothetical protein